MAAFALLRSRHSAKNAENRTTEAKREFSASKRGPWDSYYKLVMCNHLIRCQHPSRSVERELEGNHGFTKMGAHRARTCSRRNRRRPGGCSGSASRARHSRLSRGRLSARQSVRNGSLSCPRRDGFTRESAYRKGRPHGLGSKQLQTW